MPFCSRCGNQLDPDAVFCPKCGTPVAGGAATAQAAPLSGIDSVIKQPAAQQYWFERIIAFVIDAVIVYLVLGVLGLMFAIPYLFIGDVAALTSIFAGVFSAVAGIVLVFYFAFIESSWGSSVGKRAMGLVVKSKTGNNPTIGEGFIRNISKIYWLLLLLDILVGLATSREYTQKFSDRFVGTYVSKR